MIQRITLLTALPCISSCHAPQKGVKDRAIGSIHQKEEQWWEKSLVKEQIESSKHKFAVSITFSGVPSKKPPRDCIGKALIINSSESLQRMFK